MAKTPKQKTMAENHKVGTVLATGLFLIICLLIAFPLVCGLLGSFRDGAKVITTGMSLDLHSPVSMQNYSELFAIFHPKGMSADVLETSRKYFMWYKNSLVLTLTTVVLTLLVCYFVAYGLSMYKFKLQGFLFFMVIATMSVPFEILMLPLYQEITKIGLVDSNAGVFLPGLCAAGTIFFFKQYMTSLPKELLDAARVDGCTEYGIFFKIMIPLMKPSFAAMGIYQGMQSWNNFLWPMVVTNSIDKITLPVGLQSLLSPYGNNYDILIAGSCCAIIPILILFICFQRYFIEGMTAGGVKG